MGPLTWEGRGVRGTGTREAGGTLFLGPLTWEGGVLERESQRGFYFWSPCLGREGVLRVQERERGRFLGPLTWEGGVGGAVWEPQKV